MTCHIGTSGWSYDHWQGLIYPTGTPAGDRLDHYVARYGTVELNASYYRWPSEATFAAWAGRLPPGFLMSVKSSRGLTHFRRLADPDGWLARMEAGLRRLGDHLGPLLLQLPPWLEYDQPRLEHVLARATPRLQVTVERRHPSWQREETFALLERYAAAYCVMSGAGLACILRATAPFVYVRLHGPDPHHLYGGSYSADDLRWWADRLGEWMAQGRTVFAYFNNDGRGNAVRNADALRALLAV
jgi:uncharacterized protein YecE (DUF72 family)